MSSTQYYSLVEDELIRSRYPISTNAEMLALLPGRTPKGVRVRASRLGVKKNPIMHESGLPFTGSVIGHLSETQRAYLAGIIDGEGCIRMFRRAPQGTRNAAYTMYVSIANTSPLLRQWLETHLPVHVYWRPLNGSRNPRHKDGYSWILAGNRQVMVFLREICPYLVIKREQADLLAKGYLHLSEDDRCALVQKMSYLKKVS